MINDKDMSDVGIVIKKLKHDAPTIARENFRVELNILAKLQDINLLCLVGLSAGDKPLFMVFEYYGDMDLHRHIALGSPTSCESHSVEGIEDFNLLDFAMQIASDRKSTRLNSSHANISYAVFCLKKKKKITK